jgi:hypothetical protein
MTYRPASRSVASVKPSSKTIDASKRRSHPTAHTNRKSNALSIPLSKRAPAHYELMTVANYLQISDYVAATRVLCRSEIDLGQRCNVTSLSRGKPQGRGPAMKGELPNQNERRRVMRSTFLLCVRLLNSFAGCFSRNRWLQLDDRSCEASSSLLARLRSASRLAPAGNSFAFSRS